MFSARHIVANASTPHRAFSRIDLDRTAATDPDPVTNSFDRAAPLV
jgi:hypothetical protein